MDAPTELYTPKSLVSLGSSTFLVMVVTAIAHTKLGWQDPWLVALCFSELIAITGLWILPPDHWKKFGRAVVIFVAFCNGLLIYSQASGLNSINAGLPSTSPSTLKTALVDFDSVPWWPPVDQSQATRDAVDALRSGANTTQQAVAGMTDLGAPIREEIATFEHNLETIQSNRAATMRGLQSSDLSERRALEQNLVRLDDSERDTLATLNKLRAAAQVIDPAITAIMLCRTRERLSGAAQELARAATHAESIWEPVWRSAPFKPNAQGR